MKPSRNSMVVNVKKKKHKTNNLPQSINVQRYKEFPGHHFSATEAHGVNSTVLPGALPPCGPHMRTSGQLRKREMRRGRGGRPKCCGGSHLYFTWV